MIRSRFRVHRQLSELYRDHDVYISQIPGLKFGDFVRISYRTGKRRKRSIHVWLRFIDDYYRTFYNSTSVKRFGEELPLISAGESSIVLCRHYRVLLGLDESMLEEVDLEIKRVWNPLKKIRALLNAPDSMVRTTTVISIISVVLGLIALVLGILSLR